ncbi:MAG: class I SAM-dependent methyltransferase [Caldilineaceae bacterium]|nr:class I SAM-dependent methyltransferase [Caldilineaceae bacterium]
MADKERLQAFYDAGSVPWDRAEPPPEVMQAAAEWTPGRGLDLGCGLGRASIYLAQRGWRMDGVDFIPAAIAEAQARAESAGVSELIHFYTGPITELDFLHPGYDMALDVGCAHGLSEEELSLYHDQLTRLLKPGAHYLLFAHLTRDGDERSWLDEDQLRTLFARDFDLEKVEVGETVVNEQAPWRSAWFWFRRVDAPQSS